MGFNKPLTRDIPRPLAARGRRSVDGNAVFTLWVTTGPGPVRTLGRVLTLVGRPLHVAVWLAVPLLFSAAVLGVTAFFGVLLDASWQVTLSPALFGAAAAVTGLIAVGSEWPRCRRVAVRVTYPAVVFLGGMLAGGGSVPTWVAISVSLPALVTIGYLCRRERPDAL